MLRRALACAATGRLAQSSRLCVRGHKGAQLCRAEGCAGISACHPGHDGEQCLSSHGQVCLQAHGTIVERFTSE